MKKFIAKLIVFFGSILPTFLVTAEIVPIAPISEGGGNGGLGEAANHLATGPLSYMLKAFYTSCYLGGFILIYKAHSGFKAHRSNPHFAGVLMPTILLFLGIILLCLPMVRYLTVKDSLL